MNPRVFFLTTENIEKNCRSQRVPHEAYLTFKVGIAIAKEAIYAITLGQDNVANMLPVGTLIEQNIKGWK